MGIQPRIATHFTITAAICLQVLWLPGFMVNLSAADLQRPNFVFILGDNHNADTMGNAGHPFIKTPGMDRLASEGVRFENTFNTTSLCSPSRASILTGQEPGRLRFTTPSGHVKEVVLDPQEAEIRLDLFRELAEAVPAEEEM